GNEMPIEDILARYAFDAAAVADLAENSHCTSSSSSSSSDEEEVLVRPNFSSARENIRRGSLKTRAENRLARVSEIPQNVSRVHSERLLRSTGHGHAETDDSESSSEDDNFEHVEEHKKTIQVGSDFQAVIPAGLSTYDDTPAYENEDRLLWDPTKIVDENILNDYLCNVQREVDKKLHAVAVIPRGKHVRDDEQALFLLLQCDNNVEEAERRRKMQAVPPTDVMSLWSEDECRNFEDGLRLYGKNFHEIHHNKVRTRSVYELVHFYYLWKKTERHDVFAAKTRAEKRKYSLTPGATDHVDRFLEEQDVDLHQLLASQSSESKIETNDEEHVKSSLDVFSTGKTTMMSPSRHLDKKTSKGEHLRTSKHSHHHLHGEVNGSISSDQIPEHSPAKKTKKKLNELSEDSFLHKPEYSTSQLRLCSSLPLSASRDRSPGRPQGAIGQASLSKHVAHSAASQGGRSTLSSDVCSTADMEVANRVDKSLSSGIRVVSANTSGLHV
ncbi:unnamed protein product, partial [Candidula unifasciata]